jgi:uncharacterized protein (TIGR03435 family)
MALIMAAYDLRPFQISGSPATLPDRSGQDQVYDVEAVAPGQAVPDLEQVRPMLQTLLADRFRLRFHPDTKELAAYDLVTGDGPLKFKPSAPGAESKTEQLLPPTPGVIGMRLTNVTMAELVIRIAPQFDLPLFDKTGLAGGYDFTLAYGFRPRTDQMQPAEAAALEKLPPPDGPPITVALREQMGLRVVKAKEQVGILVIDRAEGPSPN